MKRKKDMMTRKVIGVAFSQSIYTKSKNNKNKNPKILRILEKISLRKNEILVIEDCKLKSGKICYELCKIYPTKDKK